MVFSVVDPHQQVTEVCPSFPLTYLIPRQSGQIMRMSESASPLPSQL